MNSTDIRDAFGRRIELHESAEVTSMGGLCACVEHLRRCGVLDALHKSLDPTLPGESVKIFVSRGIMQGPSGLRHHDANDC